MRKRVKIALSVVAAIVLLAVGVALGASGMYLPFTNHATAEGHWDYFAYSDKDEFDSVISTIPSSCDVDFETLALGTTAVFAAITNCGP